MAKSRIKFTMDGFVLLLRTRPSVIQDMTAVVVIQPSVNLTLVNRPTNIWNGNVGNTE